MRYTVFTTLALVTLIFYQCAEGPVSDMEDITRDILLEQNPNKGVLSVRMQGLLYSKDNPEIACNPNENNYVQMICDAESVCGEITGSQKLICMYDDMKLAIGEYERSLKSNEGKEEKVNQAHDSFAFGAWHDIREAHRTMKQLVNDLREGVFDNPDNSAEFVARMQEVYAMFENIKEVYGVQNQIQILTSIELVEVLHPQDGWRSISYESSGLDLAIPDLNRLVGIDALEPGFYNAIRITFGEESAIALNHPYLSETEDDNWVSHPLVFDFDDTRQRTIYRTLPVNMGKATDIGLNLNLERSFSTGRDGTFIFNPVFDVQNLGGDHFIDPDEAAQITLDNGNVVIDTQAGTFDQPVSFSAQPLAESDLPAPLDNQNVDNQHGVLLSAYDMKPDMVFNKSVKLTFSYDPALLTERGLTPEGIRVRYFNEERNQWVRMTSYEIDEASHSVSVYTNHFTIIAIEGGSGFTLEYPSGISGRIEFSALNYILTKAVTLNSIRDIHDKDFSFDIFGDKAIVGDFYGTTFDYRDLRFSIGKKANTDNTISVNVKNANPIYVGRLDLYLNSIPVPICNDLFNDCTDNCGHDWPVVEVICWAGCGAAAITCNGIRGIDFENHIYVNNIDFDIHFEVLSDAKTGAFSVAYSGQDINALNVNLENIGKKIMDFSIRSAVSEYIEDYMNGDEGLAKEIADAMDSEIGEEITKALADSGSDLGGFSLDENGIEFTYNIDMEVDDPLSDLQGTGIDLDIGFTYDNTNVVLYESDLFLASCNSTLDFPMPDDVPNGAMELTPGTDIAMGFSINATNQILTEMVNRGYFCFKYSIPNEGRTIYLQPAQAPLLEYEGNHLFKTTIAVDAISINSQGVVDTGYGALDIYYRLKMNIGGNELAFNIARIVPSFTHEYAIVREGAALLTQRLNEHIESNPGLYTIRKSLANPLNYTGYQASTFKATMLDGKNGILTLGFGLRNLQLEPDYPNREWVWTKNWSAGDGSCSMFTTGKVVTAEDDYITPYKYLLDNGQVKPLGNNGIPSTIFNSIVDTDQSVALQGACRLYALYENEENHMPTSYFEVYLADNLVTDHFYMNSSGGILKKHNLAPQAISDFESTVALYEIDIAGDPTAEILQVRYTAAQEYELDWIISNTCCQNSVDDLQKFTMPTPSAFEKTGLYRVSVINRGNEPDQVLLNCNVYDVAVQPEGVSLNLAETICTDPFAGVVIDGANSLMWSKCVVGEELYDPDCAGESAYEENPTLSSSACSDLDIGGFEDWRLPTMAEYQTIAPQKSAAPLFPEPDGVFWISDHNYSKNNVFTYKTVKASPYKYYCLVADGDDDVYCNIYRRIATIEWANLIYSVTADDGLSMQYALFNGYFDYEMIDPSHEVVRYDWMNDEFVITQYFIKLLRYVQYFEHIPSHAENILKDNFTIYDIGKPKTRCVRDL